MKKKQEFPFFRNEKRKIKQIVMRLMLVKLIMLFCLTTSFGAVKSQKVIKNLNVKNVELFKVFEKIEAKTDFYFVFNYDDVKNHLVTIDVKSSELNACLDKLLKDLPFTYEINNKMVLISYKGKKNHQTKGIKIKGKIIDKQKEPIPGATIRIKGTLIGVSTNINGEFSINIPESQKLKVLIVSFVGMKTVEVNYSKTKDLVIILEEDTKELEDVVITGYSKINKNSFTGNAISISKEDLLKASKTNIIKAIESFDPSFRIKENNEWGSDPNALPEINIRGNSSLGSMKDLNKGDISKSNLKNNPNLPTFIMDGFEISVTKLYDYDPNRIASITILKDAAATAMYGSRAANGVIIITTVAPKAGKINVSYNAVLDLTYPDLTDYNLMNSVEKLETESLAKCFVADKEAYDTQYGYNAEYYAKMANIKSGVNTYWLAKPTRTVLNNKHSLYIDGGSQTLRFGVDLQYNNQNGVMKESFRNRKGAGFSLQYSYKNFLIKNYVQYLITDSKESPYGIFSDYTKQLPYDKYKDENGHILKDLKDWNKFSNGVSKNIVNPLFEPSLHNFNKTKREELSNNLSLNWQINRDLLWKVQLGITKTTSEINKFLDPNSLNNSNPLTLTNLIAGELNITNSEYLKFDMNSTLSYNKAIGGHVINALLGVNLMETTDNGNSANYRGFPSGDLSSPNYAKEMVDKTSFNESTSRMVGLLSSVNYSYVDTYLLDISFRLDGSSSFGTDKRFAPFWSFGLGINLHKYDFIKDLKLINLLKIRASYGSTGKSNFSAYEARTTYKIMTSDWYRTGYGSVLEALGNNKLKWETTNNLDVGFELSVLDNRCYVKASYYDKRTTDLISPVTIKSSTGFRHYKDNVGEMSNKGYELALRVVALKSDDLNLIFNLNFAHNKSVLEKISDSMKDYNRSVIEKYKNAGRYDRDISVPFLQYTEGASLSSIYGMKSNGINPATGEEVFVLSNGDLTDSWVAENQVVIGNTEPKGQGSFGFNLGYRRFNFYTSFMYEFGGERYNQTLVDKVENARIYSENVDKRVLKDRWKKPGDIAKYKSIVIGRDAVETTRSTSRFVQDYNMLKLNSVELSYDVPSEFVKKMNMSMVRLTFGMNDVFCLSSVKQERGLSYPFARSMNFSLKITF